ncbi:uncharacterized protein L199_007811 [Kwoniella botswanensis]|uniref:uncharacterized protein n=1 Tax=Kwoniella botswanensis TaxID=1268659 RepID=UPI00315DBCE9
MSDSTIRLEGQHGTADSDLNARLDALLNDTNDTGTASKGTLLGATDSLLTKINRSSYRIDEKFERVKTTLDGFKTDNDAKKSTAYKYDLIEVKQSLEEILTKREEDLLTYIAHEHRPSDDLILACATFENRFLNTNSGNPESIYTNADTPVVHGWREIRRPKNAIRQLPRHFYTSRFQASAFWCLPNTYPNSEENSVLRRKQAIGTGTSTSRSDGRFGKAAKVTSHEKHKAWRRGATASNLTLVNEIDVLMSNLCEGNVRAAISDYDDGQLPNLLMQTRDWDCGNANTNKIYRDQIGNLWGTLKELRPCVTGQTASHVPPSEEADIMGDIRRTYRYFHNSMISMGLLFGLSETMIRANSRMLNLWHHGYRNWHSPLLSWYFVSIHLSDGPVICT